MQDKTIFEIYTKYAQKNKKFFIFVLKQVIKKYLNSPENKACFISLTFKITEDE